MKYVVIFSLVALSACAHRQAEVANCFTDDPVVTRCDFTPLALPEGLANVR